MRAMILFDLPTETKKEKKDAYNFRKEIIGMGYVMHQFSVYVKLFNNRESMNQNIKKIKSITPLKGNVKIIKLTEKQFAEISVLIGDESEQAKVVETIQMVIDI